MRDPFRTDRHDGRPAAARRVREKPATASASGPVSGPRYAYYRDSGAFDVSEASKGRARKLGEKRLHPMLSDPDFLILRRRRRYLAELLAGLSASLMVLDVGGRIQPYRPLIEKRAALYIGLDPQAAGLVDVVAIGEQMPFRDEMFDLVLCTQVLGYASQPGIMVDEIHRALKPGGHLFLSAPAFFPGHHDERWRFLPEGYEALLAKFGRVTISPEGLTPAGIFRTMAVFCDELFAHWLLRAVVRATAIPVLNICGLVLDAAAREDQRFTANYSVVAQK